MLSHTASLHSELVSVGLGLATLLIGVPASAWAMKMANQIKRRKNANH